MYISNLGIVHHNNHHHQLNVHFLPRLIKIEYGRLLPYSIYVDNQPFATFWDLSFSHSDVSISRKSRLVATRQLHVYPRDNSITYNMQ